MRAFPVVLPSGTRYWTVLDDDLLFVPFRSRRLLISSFPRQCPPGVQDGAGGEGVGVVWA
jgi:hypothetical protein